MLEAAELELHRTHITGSKVASILEIEGAYKSKYRLYLEMRNEIPYADIDSARIRAGNYAEEMIRKYTRKELKWRYKRIPKDARFKKHPKYPFLGGLVDGIARDGKEEFIVEMKNVDSLFKKDWIDIDGNYAIPDKFQCQVYFYMALYDLPARVIAMFGGNDFVVINVDRNLAVEEFLIKKCCEFQNDLINGNKPSVDGSADTETAIKLMFPSNDGILIDGDRLSKEQTDELISAAKEYERLKQEVSDIDKIKKKYGNLIKERIGDNDGIFWKSSGYKITHKKTKDGIKFDEKRFKETEKELYQKYLIPKQGYRRFNITIGGEK